MPGDPLKITIALTDEQQGNAPSPRDHLSDFRRAQNAADRRAAGRDAVGSPLRGISESPIGSQEIVANALEAASEHIKRISQDVPVLGVTGLLGGVAGSFVAANVRRLDEMAERYGQYSRDISLAQAEAENKQIRFEVDQARKHGPQIAEWVRAQSDVNREFERAQTGVLIKGAPDLIEILKKASPALSQIDPAHPDDSLKGVLKALGSSFGFDIPEITFEKDLLRDITKKASKWWRGKEADKEPDKEPAKGADKEPDKEAVKKADENEKERRQEFRENMERLQWDAEMERARAAAAAGLAPIDEFMLKEDEARKERRRKKKEEAEKKRKAAAAAAAAAAG